MSPETERQANSVPVASDLRPPAAGTTGRRCPEEKLVMVIWPSIGMNRLGRLIGALVGLQWGLRPVLTVGNLFAVVLAPVAALVFFAKYVPGFYRRYVVTTRRVAIQAGYSKRLLHWVKHDDWDQALPEYCWGQRPLRCADLVFWRNGKEVFRLRGVPQPEAFCHALSELKATLEAFRPLLQRQGLDVYATGP